MKTPKCKHKGKSIFKMGGLICPKCRTILHYRGTDEYNAELARVQRELEQRSTK